MTGISAQVKQSMHSMCEQLGVPPEMADKFMGMFGGSMQMFEMVMNVMEKLGGAGAQGVGGEMGPPMANLAPQAELGGPAPARDLGSAALG